MPCPTTTSLHADCIKQITVHLHWPHGLPLNLFHQPPTHLCSHAMGLYPGIDFLDRFVNCDSCWSGGPLAPQSAAAAAAADLQTTAVPHQNRLQSCTERWTKVGGWSSDRVTGQWGLVRGQCQDHTHLQWALTMYYRLSRCNYLTWDIFTLELFQYHRPATGSMNRAMLKHRCIRQSVVIGY